LIDITVKDKQKTEIIPLEILKRFGVLIGMILILLIFQIVDHRFMRLKNLIGIMNSSSPLILLSLGMMMTMAVRGIDLSVSQIADASGVIVAMLIIAKVPASTAILLTLVIGFTVGFFNMVVISYFGVPAIIGTLGTMYILRSIELTLTKGAAPQVLFTLPLNRTRVFFFIGQGSFGPITMLIILSVVIVVILYFVRERSVFGRHMDAILGNVRTAKLCSIDIRRVFGLTFIISAVLSTMAGVMFASRSGSAVARGVESYLTDCFVAVYIGMLFSKRRSFNVVGTVIGTLFVGCLGNFFTLIGLGNSFRNLFNGIFIILAVALSVFQDNIRKNRFKKEKTLSYQEVL
jgi:ribose/xylose/arabinose/galactoside ABC-type transport system permease subunit